MSCDEHCTDCNNTDCVYNPRKKRRQSYRERYESQSPFWQKINQKTCAYCGKPFIPNSPTQKYCSREDNPACDDERYLTSMSHKAYIRHTGLTKEEFIKLYGKETYDRI